MLWNNIGDLLCLKACLRLETCQKYLFTFFIKMVLSQDWEIAL